MNYRKKKILNITICAAMFAAVFSLALPEQASAATLTVPDDFPTIQQAVNAANSGDVVVVRSGTYYEHVTIDKSLTLQGEDRETTVVDGSGSGRVIYIIDSNHVTVDGLTLTNAEIGLEVQRSEDVTIINNRLFRHSGNAVSFRIAKDVIVDGNEMHNNSGWGGNFGFISQTRIANNELHHNDEGGFYTSYARTSVITGNEVHHHSHHHGGIRVSWNSDGVVVEGNYVYANQIGIYLANNAANSIVKDNLVRRNDLGINGRYVSNKIYHNDLIDNTVQARDRGNNVWDDGCPSGGNYWSDYTGADANSDGIGDTPYVFDGNQDNYPLMRPWNKIEVSVDIKPTSCPNPLNVKSKGVLPAAILGTEEFDVATIDLNSVLLNGVVPLRWNIEDVSTPVYDGEECECTTEGPDGFDDLTLKFDTQEIVEALGEVTNGEVIPLLLVGNLLEEFGGTPIEGQDCVVIKSKGGKMHKFATGDNVVSLPKDYALLQNHPNPFNPETEIRFTLPEADHVVLRIYNTLGQEIRTLVNSQYEAGYHSVSWDSKDNHGHLVASGIYLYRIQAGDFMQVRKMSLLR